RLSPRGVVASGQCFQALKGESLMKKPYHIAAGRALQRMRQWADEKNPDRAACAADGRDFGAAKTKRGRVGAGGGTACDPAGDPAGSRCADRNSAPTRTGSPGAPLEPGRWLRGGGWTKGTHRTQTAAQQEWGWSSFGHLS